MISTPSAKLFTIDIQNFYLHYDLPTPEYMFLPLSTIPQIIRAHYHLDTITQNNLTYIKITKGMYSLPQEGWFAFEQLSHLLIYHHFSTSDLTPGLLTHQSHPLSFILCVDDFPIKYIYKPSN